MLIGCVCVVVNVDSCVCTCVRWWHGWCCRMLAQRQYYCVTHPHSPRSTPAICCPLLYTIHPHTPFPCRPESVSELLQLALPVLLAGLQDRDDSVQAAAAEALVPLAPMLLQMQADDVSDSSDEQFGTVCRKSCLLGMLMLAAWVFVCDMR